MATNQKIIPVPSMRQLIQLFKTSKVVMKMGRYSTLIFDRATGTIRRVPNDREA